VIVLLGSDAGMSAARAVSGDTLLSWGTDIQSPVTVNVAPAFGEFFC